VCDRLAQGRYLAAVLFENVTGSVSVFSDSLLTASLYTAIITRGAVRSTVVRAIISPAVLKSREFHR